MVQSILSLSHTLGVSKQPLLLDELWKMMEYTAGDHSYQQHKFKFPLPTPIYVAQGGVHPGAKGAKGE